MEKQAKRVFGAPTGRDYAVMQNGDVLSVNATGLTVRDVRWPVIVNGRFMGDAVDREAMTAEGLMPVEYFGHDQVKIEAGKDRPRIMPDTELTEQYIRKLSFATRVKVTFATGEQYEIEAGERTSLGFKGL